MSVQILDPRKPGETDSQYEARRKDFWRRVDEDAARLQALRDYHYTPTKKKRRTV